MKLKKKLGFLMFLLLGTLAWGFNFSVAPTRFEVALDKVNTNEIILVNNTAEPMRLESFLEVPKGYEKHNLNESIKLYPKMISIKPGGKQIVRFRVKPEGKLETGEYKSYVVFKEIPLKDKSIEQDGAVSAQIKMITEVGISIYGYHGDIKRETEITDIKFVPNFQNSTLKIVADANAKGNSSEIVRQKIEVLSSNGAVVNTVESQFGRTERSGKLQLENTMRVDSLKGKKVRATLYDSNGKVLIKKESKIF